MRQAWCLIVFSGGLFCGSLARDYTIRDMGTHVSWQMPSGYAYDVSPHGIHIWSLTHNLRPQPGDTLKFIFQTDSVHSLDITATYHENSPYWTYEFGEYGPPNSAMRMSLLASMPRYYSSSARRGRCSTEG